MCIYIIPFSPTSNKLRSTYCHYTLTPFALCEWKPTYYPQNFHLDLCKYKTYPRNSVIIKRLRKRSNQIQMPLYN